MIIISLFQSELFAIFINSTLLTACTKSKPNQFFIKCAFESTGPCVICRTFGQKRVFIVFWNARHEKILKLPQFEKIINLPLITMMAD